MLPAISKINCPFHRCFFERTVEETEQIMNAGIHFGLKPKFM
jgi:hypothetical protein